MMITSRRQDIVDLVRRAGYMSVETLAEHFSVTTQTIRRDINLLCDSNLLRRRHGGAEYVDPPSLNLSYESRKIIHPDAKQAIGTHVAMLIPSRSSVSFGIGTTPEFAARAMQEHEELTVVTNNLNVAMVLSANHSNRIVVPGGTMRLPDRDFLGPHVDEMYRNYRVDFGIFGVGGVEPDGVFVDFDRAEVLARTAMLESCRCAILVADVSKFGRQAPARGGKLSDPDIIVLDAPPPAGFAGLFEDVAIRKKLHVAEKAT